MGAIDWYKQCITQHYADFRGRARRSEFWNFALVNVIVAIVLSLLSLIAKPLGAVAGLYGLAVLIPGLAVTVRRLHDIGKSGWWILIDFIPLVGAIILLVWAFTDSQPGTNEWGANPKEGAAV